LICDNPIDTLASSVQNRVRILWAGYLVAAMQTPAFSGVITKFKFNDPIDSVSKLADVVAPHLTATPSYDAGFGIKPSAIYHGGGVSGDLSDTGSANARPWDDGSAALALAAGSYWTFTVTAAAGYHLDPGDAR